MLSRAPRIRFTRTADEHRLEIPLPGATPEDLQLTRVDDELIVRAGARRRAVALPPRIARLSMQSARLEDGSLIVCFAQPADDSERETDSQ